MRKSKSRAGEMVFIHCEMVGIHCEIQNKRHRKPKFFVHLSHGTIWRNFVCCWHIRPDYKVIRYCFLKKHVFLFCLFNTPFFKYFIRLLIVMWMTSWGLRKPNFFFCFHFFWDILCQNMTTQIAQLDCIFQGPSNILHNSPVAKNLKLPRIDIIWPPKWPLGGQKGH